MTDQDKGQAPRAPHAPDPRRPHPDTEPIIVILGPATRPGPDSPGSVAPDEVERVITLLAHGVLAVLVIVRARRRHHSRSEFILALVRVLVRGL